jgi:CHRD domain
MRHKVLWSLLVGGAFTLAAAWGHESSHHRSPSPPKKPHVDGRTLFVLPDPAVDEDASGDIHLKQHGDRSAIHVHVHHLDRGATYLVNIEKGDKKEAMGNISIPPPPPPKPPHCFTAALDGKQSVPAATTEATGLAKFELSGRSRLNLHYEVKLRGASLPAFAASIRDGDPGQAGDVVFTLDATKLRGSVKITTDDATRLAAGEYYIEVRLKDDANETIRGQIMPRNHHDEDPDEDDDDKDDHGASGKLVIDTGKGDKLPLGATTVADLVGSHVTVLNDKAQVVLLADIKDLKKHHEGEGARCFGATLDGAQETPPVTTDATGVAKIFLGGRMRTMLFYKVKVTGLSGPVIAAHIHVGAPGVPGDVLYPLDIKDLTGFLMIKPADVANLEAGNYYVNVHTEKNPTGEIRGQIAAGDCKPPRKDDDDDHHEGGGGSLTDGFDLGGDRAAEDPTLYFEDFFFEVSDPHDAAFIRGDLNGDGVIDLADPILGLGIFMGGDLPDCEDAADTNDDGRIDISDPVTTLFRLFVGGSPLPPPGRNGRSGFDPTADELFCGETN